VKGNRAAERCVDGHGPSSARRRGSPRSQPRLVEPVDERQVANRAARERPTTQAALGGSQS
jgi:hypothetical protein